MSMMNDHPFNLCNCGYAQHTNANYHLVGCPFRKYVFEEWHKAPDHGQVFRIELIREAISYHRNK